MNHEEMERAIEFLIEHHAKFSTDIDRLTAEIQQLKELQARSTADVQSLADSVARFEIQAEADRRETRESINDFREEMREGFNKLIVANEVTRDLAQNVARLAIATGQRVTTIENKLE